MKLISASGTYLLVFKVITIFIQVASIKLISSSFSVGEINSWIFVISFVSLVQIFDLGLSSYLITRSAQVFHKDKQIGVILLTRRAFYILTLSSLFGLLLCFILYVGNLFEILLGDSSSQTLKTSALLFWYLVINLIGLPFQAANSAYYGADKIKTLVKFQIVGQVIFLANLYCAIHLSRNLELAMVGAYCGPVILNAFAYFWFIFKTPRPMEVNYKKSENLLKHAFPFLLIQISLIMQMGLDTLIVARYVSFDQVSEYSLTQKFYLIPGIVLASYLNALWPRLSTKNFSKSSSEYSEVLFYLLSRSVIFAALYCFIAFISIDIVLDFITDGKVQASQSLKVAFSVWVLVGAFGGALSTILNATGIVGIQARAAYFGAVANPLLSVLFSLKIGIAGPVVASILVMSLIYVYYIMQMYKNNILRV